MTESKTPTEFINIKSLDNLQIAGICVWLLCLTVASFSQEITSFWIRIIAFSFSLLWSISLFIKKRKFKNLPNYVIIVANALLIYITAAGVNTVTRQSPFEGFGVKVDQKNVNDSVVKASLLNLGGQINWYPDYGMIRYIDTLKHTVDSLNYEINNLNAQKTRLQNEFAYVKDRIYSVTKDSLTSNQIKAFLRDFGRYVDDTTSLAIMKIEYQKIIDSVKSELKFRDEHPTTVTSYYTIGRKRIDADAYVKKLIQIINYFGSNTKLSEKEIDSVLNANNLVRK
ncbi:hypothetical protein CLV59_103630 [Chitinophaga dinghuensis]|uniref:Uncharacterized protein n=1 Tax=Chitinophaga dinghuensis TaxID=1539050 RepID=A0A327W323_9BACT|nr:hypothetical protein [Chitinophaga dinghuensis]RAJ83659.1 hypothetical protein CLV59_103630 [Chitinophaga dinghuensis]